MTYAVRNAQGQITSLHRHDPGVGEELAADHPEVRDFLGLGSTTIEAGAASAAPQEGFTRLDADFIRVLEDVIDTLVGHNMLTITDLPESAQAKLFARKSYRDRRPKNALDLLGTQPFGQVI